MADSDPFLQTIDAVYAGGLESERMPEALEATSSLLGAVGATLEVISKPAKRPIGFWAAGLPDVSRTQYIEHFAALNPRIPLTLRQCAGDVAWDRQLFDEGQMKRDPFYSEFCRTSACVILFRSCSNSQSTRWPSSPCSGVASKVMWRSAKSI